MQAPHRDHCVMAIAVRNVHDGRRKPTLDTIVHNPRPTHSTACVCSNAHGLQTTQVHANTRDTRQNILSAPWLVAFDREHYWDSASTGPSSCIAQTYSRERNASMRCSELHHYSRCYLHHLPREQSHTCERRHHTRPDWAITGTVTLRSHMAVESSYIEFHYRPTRAAASTSSRRRNSPYPCARCH